MYSDGYLDNIFTSGSYQCLEEQLKDGVMQSLSKAADCLAVKAYWLGLNLTYLSPFNREWRKAIAEGDPWATERWLPEWGQPSGGKHDDITVTVAQIFVEKEGEPRKGIAEADTYFSESKTVYTGDVPSNRYESYTRARFDTN